MPAGKLQAAIFYLYAPQSLSRCVQVARPMSANLTKDKIERLAPDQASLGAALKLVKPAKWPVLGGDAGTALLWGECQGSGSTPYRVVLATVDLGYKCTCPSRKFPCKHVLALMWQYCDSPQRFPESAVPEWVNDWLVRRRGKSGGTAAVAANGTDDEAAPGEVRKPRGGSIAEALAETPAAPPDPKAAARAEAQRERIRQEREASVAAGLDELGLWIADQLGHGLAGFAANAAKSCRTLSARLVDAKAAGLAGQLDALSADVFRVPESQRGELVMERLGAMALISAAYRRQDALPPALKADVRRTVGWTVKREDLLADTQALRVKAPWMVVAARSEVQPDKLRRLETWLLRLDAQEGPAPQFALLLDFIPVSAGAQAAPYIPGELLLAELVFYPSATPLRAHIAAREPVPFDPLAESLPWPPFPAGLGEALAAYDATLAMQPWLDAWPVAASGVQLVRGEKDGLLFASADAVALPLNAAQADAALPLLGLEDISIAGLWDGRLFTLFAAQTPLGLWYEA